MVLVFWLEDMVAPVFSLDSMEFLILLGVLKICWSSTDGEDGWDVSWSSISCKKLIF